MEDILRRSLKEITESITNSCTRPHVQQSVETEQDNTGKESRPEGQTSSFVASDIIEEALRFANKEASHRREQSNEAFMTNDMAHVSGGGGDDQETVSNRDISEKDTVEPDVLPTTSVSERRTGPSSVPGKANEETSGNGLAFPDPSFSIGLTQLINENAQNVDRVPHEDSDESLQEDDVDLEEPILNRKSKRTKVVPRNLVGDYQCDSGIMARAWESFIDAICITPRIDYAAKFSNLLEILGGSKV
ncbi:unnamed protein product [Eruca vesicaria subsp. sativa]|uniref:Uncharacterized protein n=1 Tax=Eruca vesicaria subsp. sativa TaxID=29727 RepID=A0ABC8JF85_ERUVS|nr:unnamed protein product [Eruca vesicaria subsp. sativa]